MLMILSAHFSSCPSHIIFLIEPSLFRFRIVSLSPYSILFTIDAVGILCWAVGGGVGLLVKVFFGVYCIVVGRWWCGGLVSGCAEVVLQLYNQGGTIGI